MSEEKNIPEEQSAIGNERSTNVNENIAQPEIEIKKSEIPKSEIQNMEVHKHPHHVMHKKKWSEYLLEFFMLFLAVFLGFLAENFREHQVEKERGIKYIESFYEDLKIDTSRISSFFIGFDDSKLSVLEKLGDCYNAVSKNDTATSCLLEIIKVSSINRPFKWTERTLNQLANSGGFRLLQGGDADSIIAYQKEFNYFQDFQQTVFQDAQNNVRNTFNLLINFEANDDMFPPKKNGVDSDFRQ